MLTFYKKSDNLNSYQEKKKVSYPIVAQRHFMLPSILTCLLKVALLDVLG